MNEWCCKYWKKNINLKCLMYVICKKFLCSIMKGFFFPFHNVFVHCTQLSFTFFPTFSIIFVTFYAHRTCSFCIHMQILCELIYPYSIYLLVFSIDMRHQNCSWDWSTVKLVEKKHSTVAWVTEYFFLLKKTFDSNF